MWTNATKRQSNWTTGNNSFKGETKVLKKNSRKIQKKIIICFLAFQRNKRDVVVVIVVTFVPQSFMWLCGRSFRCSRSNRLQRVFHTTPTTVVVTWSLYSSLSHFCDVVIRSFHCSHSKRLQRVVHRMPTTTTTKASICVLSKLTWRLYKRMHLLFSSQNLHITKLRLVI